MIICLYWSIECKLVYICTHKKVFLTYEVYCWLYWPFDGIVVCFIL